MRTPILTVAGATLLIFAGCRTYHEPSHFELAEAAEKRGDKVTALHEYEESVRLEPEHKHAWRHIGYLKAETQGGKDYEIEVRNALMTFLMLETYEIGDVAGDEEMGLPETPAEPHMARTMVRALTAVINQIELIEGDALVVYHQFLVDPNDAELKALALEAEQAALDANMGTSPRARWYMGEILRRSGDAAGARSHYEAAMSQSKGMNRANIRAQASLSLVGGDLDEGWQAVQQLNRKELYVDFIEAALERNELERAVAAANVARRRYADPRIWRQLAEAQLLLDQPAGAGETIAVLEKWPGRDKDIAIFLRMVWAAESGQKTGDLAKKMTGNAVGQFNPARLAAHVEGSKADGTAKSDVKKAADKFMAK